MRFQQVFNDKLVIASCLLQYWQIFASFLMLCHHFNRLKAREISSKKYEKLRKYFPYCHGPRGIVTTYNKQIFHAFLFNISNYSPEVINIQRSEAKLNIILPRVNNFDFKQKKASNICFLICHQSQTSGKIKTN